MEEWSYMEIECCRSFGDIYLTEEYEKAIRICGSHRGGYEDFCLLGYNAV
jgi:hypothetical protein